MKTFYEAILAQGGFAGGVFDIAAGPANVYVIDTLLSVGNGAITQNIPLNIISTGSLGGNRILDITNAEQNGRIFFLSARNADLGIYTITVSATTDINGGGSTFLIENPNDFIFVYEPGGVWRCYHQILAKNGPFISLDFTYSDASPIDFGTLAADEVIVDSDIIIDTPFDDPTAILTLGLTSNTGNILPSSAIDPTVAGTYNSSENFVISGSDSVRLQIVPGTSTQGSGKVIVTVRRTQ